MEFKVEELELNNLKKFLLFAKELVVKQFSDYPLSVRNYYWEKEFNYDKLKEEIEKKEVTIYIALSDNKMVGFIVIHFDGGGAVNARWLEVEKNFRGKNIGTTLLKKIETEAKKNKCHFIYFWTETNKNVDFYKKRGYYFVGLQKESWYGMDEYLMQKNICKPFFVK